MTHVSTPIFQGLFKNIVFRSVALVIKKLWVILDLFLHTPNFLQPPKKPLNYYLLKVNKFHGDSVINESARTKQLEGGAPQPV